MGCKVPTLVPVVPHAVDLRPVRSPPTWRFFIRGFCSNSFERFGIQKNPRLGYQLLTSTNVGKFQCRVDTNVGTSGGSSGGSVVIPASLMSLF